MKARMLIEVKEYPKATNNLPVFDEDGVEYQESGNGGCLSGDDFTKISK
jgi:hypothetical protein